MSDAADDLLDETDPPTLAPGAMDEVGKVFGYVGLAAVGVKVVASLADAFEKLEDARNNSTEPKSKWNDPKSTLNKTLKQANAATRSANAFLKASQSMAKGENVQFWGFFFIGCSRAWKFLSPDTRLPLVERFAKLLKRSDKLAALGDFLVTLEQADGVAALLMYLAGIMFYSVAKTEKQMAAARKTAKWGSNDLTSKARANPFPFVRLVAHLAYAFLPRRTARKMMTKIVAKKVPVIGTIVVGAFDLWEVCKDPCDWKNWASLGSTGAAIVPGPGTAASVVIDLTVAIATIMETAFSFKFDDMVADTLSA